jgi:hypothetical protein
VVGGGIEEPVTSTRDLFVIGAVILAMLCAVVTIAFALWEVGHAWWTPHDDADREPRRGRRLL